MAGLSEVIQDMLRKCETQPGERVVLYTGQDFDRELLDTYTAALKSLDADFLRVIAPHQTRNGKVVNAGGAPLARGLFAHADLVVYVLPPNAYWGEGIPRVAQLHTPEFREVRQANPTMRWLQVGVPNPEINYRRLMPSEAMIERTLAGVQRMDAAKIMRITSPGGTDLTVSVDGQRTGHQLGIVTKDHTWDNFGCGNVSVNPVPDSAEGVLVVSPGDHWHHPDSPEALSLVREPIRLHFEGGRIRKIDGGLEASIVARAFAKYGDEGVYRIAHMGWGTHENGVWLDSRHFCIADWEGTYGTLMIHFGGYAGLGGVHVSGPTVIDHDLYLDDDAIVKGGTIVDPACA